MLIFLSLFSSSWLEIKWQVNFFSRETLRFLFNWISLLACTHNKKKSFNLLMRFTPQNHKERFYIFVFFSGKTVDLHSQRKSLIKFLLIFFFWVEKLHGIFFKIQSYISNLVKLIWKSNKDKVKFIAINYARSVTKKCL